MNTPSVAFSFGESLRLQHVPHHVCPWSYRTNVLIDRLRLFLMVKQEFLIPEETIRAQGAVMFRILTSLTPRIGQNYCCFQCPEGRLSAYDWVPIPSHPSWKSCESSSVSINLIGHTPSFHSKTCGFGVGSSLFPEYNTWDLFLTSEGPVYPPYIHIPGDDRPPLFCV